MQYANGDDKKFLEKFQQKIYMLKTPSTNATVAVTSPMDLYKDSDIPKDKQNYLYDCNGYALQSYVNFRYTVTSTCLWDVLNDPQIALKVVHNEPHVTPNSNSRVDPRSPEGENISKLTVPENDARRIKKGDIVVFWTDSGEYLAYKHLMVIETPVYDKHCMLDLDATKVKSKNGSNAIRDSSLQDVVNTFERQWLKKGAPVGVYRPVKLVR